MKSINVHILASYLAIGGAEQLLLELLKNINRERFTVNISLLREPGIIGNEIMALGFPLKTGVIKSRFDLSGIFKIAQILTETKTDVVLLINHLNTLFYGVLGAQIAGVPACINWENETYKKYPLHSITMFGRWLLHTGIDTVVAAAQGHRDYIAQVERIPRKKIEVIYNGVDPIKFRSSLTPQEAKSRLGIPPDSPVVSILAVLRPDKNHGMFIRAAQLIFEKKPETHFLIIGDGLQRQQLENTVAELGMGKNVHFLGFQRNLADILAAVDINTLSSNPEQETLSVAAIEAMSVGIPIVCTDVGFMREIVIPDKTGYLVAVGDYKEFAEKVLAILNNDSLRRHMREEAQRLVHDKLSVYHMTASFEKLIAELYRMKNRQAGVNQ